MYFSVKVKFIFTFLIAAIWLFISFKLAFPWLMDLAALVTLLPALIIIFTIALIPGFMYMFLTVSYLIDNRKSRPLIGTYPIGLWTTIHKLE